MLLMDQQHVREPEWRLESAESEARSARVLSIEEMRQRLGLERPEPTTMARMAPAAGERPRIVRRRAGMAVEGQELLAG
jgi:hypothetical protein